MYIIKVHYIQILLAYRVDSIGGGEMHPKSDFLKKTSSVGSSWARRLSLKYTIFTNMYTIMNIIMCEDTSL